MGPPSGRTGLLPGCLPPGTRMGPENRAPIRTSTHRVCLSADTAHIRETIPLRSAPESDTNHYTRETPVHMTSAAAVPEGGIPRHAFLALATALHQALTVHEDPACSATLGGRKWSEVELGTAGTRGQDSSTVGPAKHSHRFLYTSQPGRPAWVPTSTFCGAGSALPHPGTLTEADAGVQIETMVETGGMCPLAVKRSRKHST